MNKQLPCALPKRDRNVIENCLSMTNNKRNTLITKGFPLAQTLQTFIVFVSFSACILPPPLELDQPDGGVNSAPVILSASPPDVSFPQLRLERNDSRTVDLQVHDPDVEDSLFVRLYVDYGLPDPTPALAECSTGPSTSERVINCSLANLCFAVPEGDTSIHYVDAMIADRGFLSEGTPAFRAVPEQAQTSIRTWTLECVSQ